MSLTTKYSLLKKKYEDILGDFQEIVEENVALKQQLSLIHTSPLESSPYVQVEVQEIPGQKQIEEEETLRRKALAHKTISGTTTGSSHAQHSTTTDEEMREKAAEMDRQTLEAEKRTQILVQELHRACSLVQCIAHQELLDLMNSWQYKNHSFCFFGQREPGYLVVLMHSLVFIPINNQTQAVDISFSEVSAIVRTQDLFPSLHLIFRNDGPKEDPSIIEDKGHLAPVPSGFVFSKPIWGFEGFLQDTKVVIDSYTTSRVVSSGPTKPEDVREAAASGRGAEYWMNRQEPTAEEDLEVHARVKVVIETYEHERYMTSLLGWSSSYLLPSDPPKWSNRHGTVIQDPKRIEMDAPRSWKFLSDWDVDSGVIGVVERVLLPSQASDAGLMEGDVITGFLHEGHLHGQDEAVDLRAAAEFQTFKQLEAHVKSCENQSIALTVFRPQWNATLTLVIAPPESNHYPTFTLNQTLFGCRFVDSSKLRVLKGWQYAPSFKSGGYKQKASSDCVVRRRRWTREVEVYAEDIPSMHNICAVTSTIAHTSMTASFLQHKDEMQTPMDAEPAPSLVYHTLTDVTSHVISGFPKK